MSEDEFHLEQEIYDPQPPVPQSRPTASSRGGTARAARLTPAERKEIARAAAEARWGTVIHTATHVGEIRLGDMSLQCAVLEDGTRLINQSTMLSALGRHPFKSRGRGAEGVAGRAPFLQANNLQPFISDKLLELSEPMAYRVAGTDANRNWGYRAELLPQVCDIYLEARAEGVLVPAQRATARAAEILVRGLARVGIVALVDEATGYQQTREHRELQRILETYVREELRPWIKKFPDDFFREIYRVYGWKYREDSSKRTPLVGTLINKYIYEQLPPGVLQELQQRNPRTEKGHRAHRHHQFIADGTGNEHLDRQISAVTVLLRASRNKMQFIELFERVHPPAQPSLPLIIEIDDTE